MDDNLASENVIYNFESRGSPQLATGTGLGLLCVGPSAEQAKAEQSKGTGRKLWGRVMAVGPNDSLRGHGQGMDRSGYGHGIVMGRAWRGQGARVWAGHGQSIWAGNMGRAYEQGIWAEHMDRAYGQGILAGQGGQRGVWNGMAESGVHLTILTRDLTCFIYY